MRLKRSLGRSLLAAVRCDTSIDDLVQAFAGVDEAQIIDLAVRHRVAGRLHARLEPLSLLTAASLDALALHRRRAAANHLLALRLADRLGAILPEDWVLFKGPALAQIYAQPDHRTYSDLDILVRRRDFRSSVDSLTDAGLVSVNQNWKGFLDRGVAELPLDSGPMILDLHWDPIALRSQRRSLPFDTNAMIDRRVPVALGGHHFDTFDPVDTLLHLCVHSGLGGGARLVWLLDIDTVLRSYSIDWDIFVARAAASGVSTMSAMLLERARRLLGTPVPLEVEGALKPSKLVVAANRAIRSLPRSATRLGGGLEFGLLQSAARDDLAGTAVALHARFSANVREYLRESAPDPDLDWRRSSGGTSAKAAWLDYTESDRL